MRYITKPFTIDAIQFTGANHDVILETFLDIKLSRVDEGRFVYILKVYDYLQREWIPVNTFDYIIKGMKGEYYPCDPEVFKAKYEPGTW